MSTWFTIAAFCSILAVGLGAVALRGLRRSRLQQKRIEALEHGLTEAARRARDAEARHVHEAYHDPLTGLPNRALLADRLQQAIEHAQRAQGNLGLLFLDLDRFKIINDTLGHAVGDQLLRTVALRLRECVRAEDTIARLGGDEFMVLLADLSHAGDAGRVAEKILAHLAEPFQCEGHELAITTSIGISLYPENGTDAGVLMKNADLSMYRAKEAGRNAYRYHTADMNTLSRRRLDIEAGLRHAIERGELSLDYQPIVESVSEAILHIEALARWQSANGEAIRPAEFIAVAEDTGLIIPMGTWMLQCACEQARLWHEAGTAVRGVAVNVSSRQLHSHAFPRMVADILSRTGLPPHALILEIAESAAMRHSDRTIATLHTLREIGVPLVIDDFGTGHSSLAWLKRMPLDAIKIDSSFIADIPDNHDSAAIVAAMIAMAHNLHLKVIAEGVETREQLAFLRLHRCDQAQGYLFGRPRSAQDVTGLFRPQGDLFGQEDVAATRAVEASTA